MSFERLETIASLIKPCKIIADVGCDHGYLIDIAFRNNLIKKAYAIDNKIGPLNSAKENLNKYNNVIYLLQDGLTTLNSDVDCVCIAGMGGLLIVKILTEGFNNLNNVQKIIIEANRDNYEVRKFMILHNFDIIEEKIVKEDGVFYEIDVFSPSVRDLNYNDDQLYFGPILMAEKNNIFKEKWENEYNKFKTIKQKEEYAKKIRSIL